MVDIQEEDDWYDGFTQEPLFELSKEELIKLVSQNTSQVAVAVARYPSSIGKACIQSRKKIIPKEEIENDHPNEYKNVFQNSTQIVIQSLENAIRAIRTYKNHILLCDECGTLNAQQGSTIIKKEVNQFFEVIEPLLKAIKKS